MSTPVNKINSNTKQKKIAASFRDPSGFLYTEHGVLYRLIHYVYKDNYELLMSSKLYEKLTNNGQLIPHTEVKTEDINNTQAYKIIAPEKIHYISYPYEWCFSQLKEAALTTLRIQLQAIKHGMTLKDATAYNIQFHHGRCVFIDTLSFDAYKEGQPWVAYRQFCQHFLAPLALMSYIDPRLNQLLRSNIDGIPLDLANRLLPFQSMLNFSLLGHIHMHAKMQDKYADSANTDKTMAVKKSASMSSKKMIALIHSLASAIKGLKLKKVKTEWGNYYQNTNYQDPSMKHKETLLERYIALVKPKAQTIQDLGANDGRFSRIAVKSGAYIISQDIDIMAVEKNYHECQNTNEKNILPLLQDLANPSPATGWNNKERASFIDRANVDIVLALALIHHLAISNNVPLNLLSSFFSNISDWLIIEFVPKSDSQVRRLLSTREDIFPMYTLEGFKSSFSDNFKIIEETVVNGSERTLFLLKKIKSNDQDN